MTEVRDYKSIALNYIKGWFFIDVLTVIPFDKIVPKLEKRHSQISSVAKFARFGRLYKLIRMTRLAKLFKLLKSKKTVAD